MPVRGWVWARLRDEPGGEALYRFAVYGAAPSVSVDLPEIEVFVCQTSAGGWWLGPAERVEGAGSFWAQVRVQ